MSNAKPRRYYVGATELSGSRTQEMLSSSPYVFCQSKRRVGQYGLEDRGASANNSTIDKAFG